MGLGCVLLIVASAGLEIIGLGLLAMDLWRVQRRELGTPEWMQRLRGLWDRLRRRPQPVHLKGLDAALSTEAAVRLRVKRGAADATVESRLAALEANLAELDQATEHRFADMEERLTAAHQRADEVRAYIDEIRRDQEDARREDLRASIPRQWRGTLLFAIGALLGMWANLAC
jgi:hypothetical protein